MDDGISVIIDLFGAEISDTELILRDLNIVTIVITNSSSAICVVESTSASDVTISFCKPLSYPECAI